MSSVEARLKEREEVRRAAAEWRRAERESDRRLEEVAGYFSQQFAAKKAAIEELLCGAEDVPQDQLPTHLDSLSTQCHALQKFLSDSTLFLTSYELRTSQQVEAEQQSSKIHRYTRKGMRGSHVPLTSSNVTTHPPQALPPPIPSLTTYHPTPTTSPSHKPVSPTKPKYCARRPHTQVQKTTSAMVLLIDPPSPDEVPGYHETNV